MKKARRFRTRPRDIQAILYLPDGSNEADVRRVGTPWVSQGPIEHVSVPADDDGPVQLAKRRFLWCQTLNGPALASPGDWLVLQANEVYPVKPEEMDARYQEIL